MQDIEAKRWAAVRECFGPGSRGGGEVTPSKPGVSDVGAGEAPVTERPPMPPAKPEGTFGGRALPSMPASLASRVAPSQASEKEDLEPVAKAPEDSKGPGPEAKAPEGTPSGEKAPEPPAVPVAPISPPQPVAPMAPPLRISVPSTPSGGPPVGGGLRLNPIRSEGRVMPAPIRTPESLGLSTPPAPPRPAGVPTPPPPPIGFLTKPEVSHPPSPSLPVQLAPAVPAISFSPPATPPTPIGTPPMPPAGPVVTGAGVPPLAPIPPVAVPPVVPINEGTPPVPAAPAAPEPKKAGDFFKKMAWKKGPE